MRVTLALVFLALAVGVAAAQPAGGGEARPDFAKAAALYKQAEAAMTAGQFADAARDYAAAYDITKDPVLFFKIGGAQEKAGNCALALNYFKLYLAEGTPSEEYRKLTEERIAACEAAGKTEKTETEKAEQPETVEKAETAPGSGAEGAAPVEDSTAQLSERPSLTGSKPSRTRGVAWITLGVGIAFGTLGTVSMLSAEAAEKDLQDLYSLPIAYTDETRALEQKLIDQGERYELLSWIAFGAAGATFLTATVLFVASADDDQEPPPVSVQVGHGGATIVGAWQF
jgi:tetratricopeptide (TPR) repeat protein